MHRRVWLSTLGFLLLLSPAALGQPRDSAAGDRLFKEGRAAFDKGDYATACPKFAESQKADPAPGTILNLALCEERLGKFANARGHVVELLAQLDVKDDRIPIGKELFNKLDARVARFSITLAAGAPANTLVRLVQQSDSRPLAFGSEIFLDPGTYSLEITAPGRPDSHTEITLGEGQRETRAIAPAEAEKVKDDKNGGGGGGAGGGRVTGPGEVPPPPSSAPLRRTIGFVAGGVGVASFIGAGITGGILIGKNSELSRYCNTTTKKCSDPDRGLPIADSAQKLLPINTATWIIGIAGVSTGVVLILTSLGKDNTKDQPKELPVTPSAAVLPGGGGIGMSGRF